MEALLTGLLVVVVVTLVVFAVGIVVYVRRLDDAVAELKLSLKEFRENTGPLCDDIRQVLTNTDGLVTSARGQMQSIARVTESVEHLVEGKTIMDAAGKAVSTSRSTLVSVLQGIKEGLRALRSSKKDSEEVSDNEQQP